MTIHDIDLQLDDVSWLVSTIINQHVRSYCLECLTASNAQQDVTTTNPSAHLPKKIGRTPPLNI